MLNSSQKSGFNPIGKPMGFRHEFITLNKRYIKDNYQNYYNFLILLGDTPYLFLKALEK